MLLTWESRTLFGIGPVAHICLPRLIFCMMIDMTYDFNYKYMLAYDILNNLWFMKSKACCSFCLLIMIRCGLAWWVIIGYACSFLIFVFPYSHLDLYDCLVSHWDPWDLTPHIVVSGLARGWVRACSPVLADREVWFWGLGLAMLHRKYTHRACTYFIHYIHTYDICIVVFGFSCVLDLDYGPYGASMLDSLFSYWTWYLSCMDLDRYMTWPIYSAAYFLK